jgi:hypothetical protein
MQLVMPLVPVHRDKKITLIVRGTGFDWFAGFTGYIGLANGTLVGIGAAAGKAKG